MILNFDFSSSVPLYMQLRNQVVIGIAEGKLVPGEKLPTIRALAEESGINMMTVSKAYQLLKQEGYILTDRRSGAVVAPRERSADGEGAGGAHRAAVIPPETLAGLRLHLSELRLTGMSREDAMKLCETLFEEGES